VVAVFTGADLAKDRLGTMVMTLKRKRPDGSPMLARPHLGLTQDRVGYVGVAIALVVAETRAQAEDAAELVQVGYERVPSGPSRGTLAAASAPRAGSSPSTGSCCGRPASSAGPSSGRASAARRSSRTSTRGTT